MVVAALKENCIVDVDALPFGDKVLAHRYHCTGVVRGNAACPPLIAVVACRVAGMVYPVGGFAALGLDILLLALK